MSKRSHAALNVALGAALTTVVVGAIVASGAPNLQYANFAAATFTPVDESTHNKMGSSVCGSFQAHANTLPVDVLSDENKGDLNTNKGGFLQNVRLPQRATVKRFSLFANDNDSEDAHAYLIRKRLKAGLSPQFTGYTVMARADSSGAVLNTMRRFTDSSINRPGIDNSRFDYYVEMINCGVVEPFATQIAYTG